MKPFVIGLVLAVVLLAASFLAPKLLQPATGPTTLAALKEAELARRQLHAYDASLPLVEAGSDIEQLKGADFETLTERSRDEFDTLGNKFNEHVRQAKATDRETGLAESDLRAVATTAGGVQSAVSSFERLLRENRTLLADAEKAARSAGQSDRAALGVRHVAGIVKLVEAAGLLADARQVRARLTTEQARAFAAAARWATTRDEMNHYAGLDVTNVRQDLERDLGEVKAAWSETQAEVDELTRVVAEREEALAALRAELEQARTERLSMEEVGFTVGDDASFEAYREEYLQVSRRLRELQDREQLLALGGIQGGSVVDDDLLGGRIEGGQTVVGLNELQRRLAVAQDKLERFTGAQQALEDQGSLVGLVADEAQTQQRNHQARLDALAAELEQILAQMAELAQQGYEKEDAALRAAREAAGAFGDAKSAVRRWIDAAQELQREKDPQRLNARLKRIVGDNLAGEFPTSAEAQARTLVGRIHTERALGLAAYLDTLRRINELRPGGELEVAKLQEDLNTARDAAIDELSKARGLYEPLAQRQTDTNWVHQASLAALYHLLGQIDVLNAQQHRSNLIGELGKAVEKRQQSPHLQTQVALYRLLTGGMEPAPQPGPQEGAVEPGDEEPTDEDDDE